MREEESELEAEPELALRFMVVLEVEVKLGLLKLSTKSSRHEDKREEENWSKEEMYLTFEELMG